MPRMARRRACLPLLAGILLGLSGCFVGRAGVRPFVGAPGVSPKAPRTVVRAEGAVSEAPAQDDGKALDPSSPVGLVGQLVLSLALLPYVVLWRGSVALFL